ncbi:MAG: hypothetical protein KAJ07_00995 [Planctomycetes bacterium]|nr:hypothetical protein [Planctomycetota bacterium]
MKEQDFESQELSEDKDVNAEKLVPVGEAIRYRKRAQSAEQAAEALTEELATSKEQGKQLTEKLQQLESENAMTMELVSAGAIDLEAAMMMTKSRLTGGEDIKDVVAQLRAEKGYLFVDRVEQAVLPRTSGVKHKRGGAVAGLEAAAKRAASSGSRADIHEYLKVRRQFVK